MKSMWQSSVAIFFKYLFLIGPGRGGGMDPRSPGSATASSIQLSWYSCVAVVNVPCNTISMYETVYRIET